MQLTTTQKQELYHQGYTLVREAVPRRLVDEALRAINADLGATGLPPDELEKMRQQTYCAGLTREPVITDLFNASSLKPLAESVIGPGNLNPVGYCQIALRFPSLAQPKPPTHHLDGKPGGNNGVAPGTIGNFTSLVGVFLSDLPGEYAGNFAVWPGTHRAYEKVFREHGPDVFLTGIPKFDLPQPHQITARAGDAVICHYQLAHGVTPNASPHIRYASFIRLKHRAHDSHKLEVLSDIWRDWPGMADVVAQAESAAAD